MKSEKKTDRRRDYQHPPRPLPATKFETFAFNLAMFALFGFVIFVGIRAIVS